MDSWDNALLPSVPNEAPIHSDGQSAGSCGDQPHGQNENIFWQQSWDDALFQGALDEVHTGAAQSAGSSSSREPHGQHEDKSVQQPTLFGLDDVYFNNVEDGTAQAQSRSSLSLNKLRTKQGRGRPKGTIGNSSLRQQWKQRQTNNEVMKPAVTVNERMAAARSAKKERRLASETAKRANEELQTTLQLPLLSLQSGLWSCMLQLAIPQASTDGPGTHVACGSPVQQASCNESKACFWGNCLARAGPTSCLDLPSRFYTHSCYC